MTQRAELAPERGRVVTLPVNRRRPPAPAAIVPLGAEVSGLMFDAPPGGVDARRLAALIDGVPLKGPSLATVLGLRAGGQRRLLLVGGNGVELAGHAIELTLDGRTAASADPSWLQSPLAEPADLLDGLSDAGRRRLLGLFLTTAASLFGPARAAELGRAAAGLLELLGVPAIAPIAWRPVGRAARILSYAAPVGVDPARVGETVLLADGEVSRLPGCRMILEGGGATGVLHVFAPRPLPADAALVGLGETPVHLLAPGADQAARALPGWLATCDPAVRRWACGIVEAEAARDAAAAALLRELRHGDGAPPVATVRHLSATPAGLLYAIDLADPACLVRAVRFERAATACEVEVGDGAVAQGASETLAGFAGLPLGLWDAPSVRVRLVHHSGRVRTAFEGAPAAFAGTTPDAFAAAAEPAAAKGLATARLTMERCAAPVRIEDFGPAARRPRLSVVAPVGGDLDVIRARAALLFAEPDGRGAELVYYIGAGRLAAAARAALADAAAVYGLAHRLVILPEAADAAAGFCAALDAARGGAVLALGAEVLPAGRGWLAAWLRAIGPDRPVVGGTLLAVDGSVLDAGVPPGRQGRAAARRGAGLPGSGLPRGETAATTRVTAECVGLAGSAAAMLRRETGPHPAPDVLLAQLVARLSERGIAPRTLLRGRCVRYGAAPVRDPLTLAADALALERLLKGSFSPVGEESGS